MKELGGYFELELNKGTEFHPNAIALNTARNALELILRTKKYNKVYIPYYTCEVILEPFEKSNTQYQFYSVDQNFEPIFDFSVLKKDEGFLYTNYFGLKDSYLKRIAGICPNLIIDNSQAFFSKPIGNIPTFYSCRKFFGVPDGAYLYLENITAEEFPIDNSGARFAHLLKRIEFGAEDGYLDFKNNDNSLIGQPIKQMSKLTKSLLLNIDYKLVAEHRRKNFLCLHEQLKNTNEIGIDFYSKSAPMIYPYLTNDIELKEKLILNHIYVATYWPNISRWMNSSNSHESYLMNHLIPIPIDQRLNIYDIEHIVKIIQECKNNT